MKRILKVLGLLVGGIAALLLTVVVGLVLYASAQHQAARVATPTATALVTTPTAVPEHETPLFAVHNPGGLHRSPPFNVVSGARYVVGWVGNVCPVGVTVEALDSSRTGITLVADAKHVDSHGQWGGTLPSDVPPGQYYLSNYATCSFDLYLSQFGP